MSTLNLTRRVLIGLALTAACPALGYVETISGNVGPTMTYLGEPTNMWTIPGAPLSDGTVDFYGGPSWSIAPSWSSQGSVEWYSPLDQDLSSGGRAHATFGAGGSFSVAGRLYQSNQSGSALLTDGLLFSGFVLDFEIIETIANLNRIDMVGIAVVFPTGGWLLDQGYVAGDEMFGLSFIGVDCQQNSGDLTSFQDDIITLSAMQFVMFNLVPEPSSVLLLLGGVACLMIRRRGGHA